jgi:hypothetical protein
MGPDDTPSRYSPVSTRVAGRATKQWLDLAVHEALASAELLPSAGNSTDSQPAFKDAISWD